MHLEAGGQRVLHVLGPGVGGQRDRRRPPPLARRELPDAADQRVAVGVGHADVADDDVGPRGGELAQRLGGGAGRVDLGAVLAQHLADQRQGVRLVVDDQQAQPVQARRLDGAGRRELDAGRRPPAAADRGDRGARRDLEHERRPLPLARALGPHRAAVGGDQLLDDRQAEAEAAVTARGRGVRLLERLEDVGQRLAPDPLAGVLHRHAHVGALALCADPDAAPLGRELHRVRQQVPDDLLHPIGVGGDDQRVVHRLDRDGDPLALRGRRHRLDRRRHCLGDLGRAQAQRQLAADDARDVEDVLDQRGLRPRVALDDGQAAVDLGRRVAPAQRLRPAEDRVQRRAQLVRDHGQELVLGAAGQLGLAAQPLLLGARGLGLLQRDGVLDRHRRVVGELLREGLVVLAVAAPRLGVDEGHRPQGARAAAQRRHQRRLEAQLADDAQVLGVARAGLEQLAGDDRV